MKPFLDYVEPELNSGCWLWAGGQSNGYGHYSPTYKANYLSHRVSYEMHKGPIPRGAVVMHACDTPLCVNPAHLSLGSRSDNIRDAVAKGRLVGRKGIPRAVISEDQKAIMESMSDSPLKAVARAIGCSPGTVRSYRDKAAFLSRQKDQPHD